MIRDLVQSFGLTIGVKKGPGVICAISTLINIYDKYGYHILSRVLRLVISTWEGDANSFSANILNAVTKLCVVFKDQLNDEVFKEKVGMISPKMLSRIAKERGHGSMGYAEAMVLEYNGKRRNNAGKLFISKLHARNTKLWMESDADDEDFVDDDGETPLIPAYFASHDEGDSNGDEETELQ